MEQLPAVDEMFPDMFTGTFVLQHIIVVTFLHLDWVCSTGMIDRKEDGQKQGKESGHKDMSMHMTAK